MNAAAPIGILHDRLERAIEAAENARELLVDSFTIHTTKVAQRTNDVMKALTVISIILLPISTLAGIMGMNMKAGQGLFYEAARTRDFPGMLQLMKSYVKSRGSWIDSVLLNDSSIPETPHISPCGPAGFPADQLLFNASAYSGANGFAALKWRLAEISAPKPSPG